MITLDMTDKSTPVNIITGAFSTETGILTLQISLGAYSLIGKTVTAVFSKTGVETSPLTVTNTVIQLPIVAGYVLRGVNEIQLNIREGLTLEQSPIMTWRILQPVSATDPSDSDVDVITWLLNSAIDSKNAAEEAIEYAETQLEGVGDTQTARIVSEGDTQELRVTDEGNTQVQRVQDEFPATVDELNERIDTLITTPISGEAAAQELIDARGGKATLGDRFGGIDSQLEDVATQTNSLKASKAEKTEVNATNLRIDNLVIPISPENTNIEVTDAHNSIVKNKNFASLKARLEESEQDLVAHKEDYATLKDVLPGSVTKEKTNLFTTGKNLFNVGTVTEKKSITRTGEIVDSPTFFYSEFIPVNANTKYTLNVIGNVAIYNQNKEFISRPQINSSNPFITISNKGYVRISAVLVFMNQLQFEIGETPTSFEDYKEEFIGFNLKDMNNSIIKTEQAITENVKINHFNWVNFAHDLIFNGITPTEDIVSYGLIKQNVTQLEIPNLKATKNWLDFYQTNTTAIPFWQLVLDGLLQQLQQSEINGYKVSKVNYEVELYIPNEDAFTIEHEIIGYGGGTKYFGNKIYTAKPIGSQKILLSGYVDIGEGNWNDIPSNNLIIYIIFRKQLTDNHVYLGYSSAWVYDTEHKLIPDYIKGDLITSNSIKENKLSESVREKLNPISAPKKSVSVVLTGSSITWGNGYLDDSFVGEVDDYLRNELSTTILHDNPNINYSISPSIINNKKFYKGKASKLEGVGNQLSFELYGDELSIVQGLERSNIGASIIELYIDGALYDTFNNYNEYHKGTEVKIFTGNGTDVKFDLEKAFTYNHAVKVNGVLLKGSINGGSSMSNTIPVSDDYMIIRKYGDNDMTGEMEVHHYVWFKNAPANGANIEVSFNYGENIAYAKTTMGEVGEGIGSALENPYGDGDVSFDPANPSSMSSGLDFRYTDDRAVKTWRFSDYKNREFTIKIKTLDSRSTGTPYFILNFATNRMHKIMNAGIGGWTASNLFDDTGLRNYKYLMEFNPNIVFIEAGTNDDWIAGNQFVATRTITNVSESELRKYPSLWLESSSYIGANNYTIETAKLVIEGIAKNSVKINGTNANLTDIQVGDCLVIGDYHFDERQVAVRIIDAWDSVNRIATFKQILNANDILNINTLADLVGKSVMVKRLGEFIPSMTNCIDGILNIKPDVKVGLVSTGLCNFTQRLLLGYPEKLRELATEKNIEYVDAFNELMSWQYSQPKTKVAYLNAANNDTADGSASYNLVNSSGTDINVAEKQRGVRGYSIKVNGIERYGKDCYVDNAFGYFFKTETIASNLTFSNWDNRNSRFGIRYIDTKLVFTDNIPNNGDLIEVNYCPTKWSWDDCHMTRDGGIKTYGKSIIELLKNINVA